MGQDGRNRGVQVRTGVSCFYVDNQGNSKFVVPPTESHREGRSLGQKLGRMTLLAALEPSPAGDVASGVAKQVMQSQGSPVLHVSPQESLVSPRKSLKRAREGGESLSSSPARRQMEESSLFSNGSPHKTGESPQMGEGGALVTQVRQLMTPRASHLSPRSSGRRQGMFSSGFGNLRAQEVVFRKTGEMGFSLRVL